MDKKKARLRRAARGRARIRRKGVHRLCVFKTSRHIYAQIIAPDGDKVLATASTVEADVRKGMKYTGNKDAAAVVGKAIAEKAKAAGIETVAFDRSGFKYHGRIKALADTARENGLKF
ncbi:MAG: 50S ribosomal protein L18 [Gammaproteobacteria bacterium]